MSVNPNFLKLTSEKTIEVNVLHDLATCLEQNGFRVTILSPTAPEEKEVGFDEKFIDLPSGRTLALQFKRPLEHDVDNSRFIINRDQLIALRTHFPSLYEAYYVFSPFPTTLEFMNNRQNLLWSTSIVEIHDQNLRIDHRAYRTVISSKTNAMDVSIVTIRNQRSQLCGIPAILLCPLFTARFVGTINNSDSNKKFYDELKNYKKKKFSLAGLYIVHISNKK